MNEIVIRKSDKIIVTLEMLEEYKAITMEQLNYLKEAVRSGKSIIVTGRSGSGKTTVASALMREADKEKTVSLGEMGCNIDVEALVENIKDGKAVIATRHTSLHEAEDLPEHIKESLDKSLNNGTIIEVETVMDRDGHRRVTNISGEKTFEMLEYNAMTSVGITFNQMGVDCGRYESIKQDLKDRKVFIVAGGTRTVGDKEILVSTKETVELGYKLAESARDRGAYVVLVADLVEEVDVPDNISFFRVKSIKDIEETLEKFRKPEYILIEAYENKLGLNGRTGLYGKSKKRNSKSAIR